jgi:hypothetical protein
MEMWMVELICGKTSNIVLVNCTIVKPFRAEASEEGFKTLSWELS